MAEAIYFMKMELLYDGNKFRSCMPDDDALQTNRSEDDAESFLVPKPRACRLLSVLSVPVMCRECTAYHDNSIQP